MRATMRATKMLVSSHLVGAQQPQQLFWGDALGAVQMLCRIGHLEGMARLLASRRPYPAQASPGR